MTRPVYAYGYEGGEETEDGTYALFRGPLGAWFRGKGIPAYRSNVENGWWVRRERLSDVMALLETDGYLVRYSLGTAPRWVPPPLAQPEDNYLDDHAMGRSA